MMTVIFIKESCEMALIDVMGGKYSFKIIKRA